MGLLANPWVLVAIAAAWLGSCGIVGVKAYNMGVEHEVATQARIDKATAQAQDMALTAAAEQIAKIDVKNTTIRQKVETITHEVPVYRDCVQPADGLRLVNEALAPPDASPSGVHQGELPGPDTAK